MNYRCEIKLIGCILVAHCLSLQSLKAADFGNTPQNTSLSNSVLSLPTAVVETYRLKYLYGVQQFLVWFGRERVWLRLGETYRGFTVTDFSLPSTPQQFAMSNDTNITLSLSYQGKVIQLRRRAHIVLDALTGKINEIGYKHPWESVERFSERARNIGEDRFCDLMFRMESVKYAVECNGTNVWIGHGGGALDAEKRVSGWYTNNTVDVKSPDAIRGECHAVLELILANGDIVLTNGVPVTVLLKRMNTSTNWSSPFGRETRIMGVLGSQ